ncbi:MAG: LON peptidase substrate-binding domain-containing protein [Pseudomonadaceae bacterium]|nr:LON peptidase substrate-binding domain-containing protein [Pseudomonadaceae bacterium]
MTTDETVEIPLFPLRSVLFPGGVLPLRIFEPRYVDMVSRCMREEMGFGVVLIREGAEARLENDVQQPDVFHIGTEAEIVDFNQADNGLLGIVTRGRRKFMVLESYETSDHLLMGRVEFLAEEAAGELLPEHDTLISVLKELTQHPLVQRLNIEVDFTEARSVSLRLAELLPIEPEIKQALLQLRWPRERLAELSRIVGKFQG